MLYIHIYFGYNLTMTKNQISLDFVSDLKYTEFCVLVFSFIKNVLNISDEDLFKIEISLREIVNNAILHGNKMDPEKRVYVTFRWSKKRFYVSIKDESQEKVNFGEIDKQLENNDLLCCHGRGIMIVKNYMDKVRFLSSSHGTTIMMEKQI
ncbi:MAG: ATP-binding protein [Candidatus Omnitrophota bacterium]